MTAIEESQNNENEDCSEVCECMCMSVHVYFLDKLVW